MRAVLALPKASSRGFSCERYRRRGRKGGGGGGGTDGRGNAEGERKGWKKRVNLCGRERGKRREGMEYVVVEKDEGERERMAVERKENPQGSTTMFTLALSHQHNDSFCQKRK